MYSWNYADILWNGIQAKAVAAVFEQLSCKEQWYLEKRNAICMSRIFVLVVAKTTPGYA